jgi:hypothetical protein
METKIYLVENCYGDLNKVYIGKTINSRKNNHQQTYGKYIIYTEIDKIDSLDYENWKSLEIYWIEQFRQWGFEVLNNNKGGGGPSKWSDKLLNSQENQIRKEKIKNNKERADKISKKNKGKPLTEEHKLKLRVPKPNAVGKKKKSRTNIEKEKISKALKGRDVYWIKGTKLSEKRKEQISKRNSKSIIQYDVNGNFIKEWISLTEASKNLNLNICGINNCLRKGFTSSSGGYKWKYKN